MDANPIKQSVFHALIALGLGTAIGFVAVLVIGPFAVARVTISLSLFLLWITGSLTAIKAGSWTDWLIHVLVSAVAFATTSHVILTLLHPENATSILEWIGPPVFSCAVLLLLTAPLLLVRRNRSH